MEAVAVAAAVEEEAEAVAEAVGAVAVAVAGLDSGAQHRLHATVPVARRQPARRAQYDVEARVGPRGQPHL